MPIPLIENVHQQVPEATLQAVHAVKAYLMHDERTAWRGVRAARRSEDFLSLTLDEARIAAEDARTRGSTQNIEERPALLITTTAGWLIATQIDGSNPLSGFSPQLKGQEAAADLNFFGIDSAVPLAAGSPARSAARALLPTSPFWSGYRQDADFFVLAWLPKSQAVLLRRVGSETKQLRDATKPVFLDSSPFRCFQAITSPSVDLLSWTSSDIDTRATAVRRIVKQCAPRVLASQRRQSR